MPRDYYDVLGVGRDASTEDIRKAYKQLARKYHPDLNAGDADAEERFKEVGEANSVLSDPEKRRLYDRFGVEGLREGFDPDMAERMRQGGFGGFGGGPGGFGGGPGGFSFQVDPSMFEGGGFNFEDLLGAMGGAGGRGGGDIHLKLRVGFDVAARGDSKRFTYARQQACGACSGRGRNVEGGICGACGGRGTVEGHKSLTINIPPGADTGDEIRVKGRGHAGRAGRPAGDLLIELVVDADPRFERKGRNLYVHRTISALDALLGTEVEVEGLDGTLAVKVPSGMASGKKIRMSGQGLERQGTRGDLLVEVRIDASLDKLTEEERASLARLREERAETAG